MKQHNYIKYTLGLLLVLVIQTGLAQNKNDEVKRLAAIKNQLTALSVNNPGLTETFKTEIEGSQIKLSLLLLSIAEIHKLNINPSNAIDSYSISPNFPSVLVTDLLVFLCKEYQLTIDFTGNIMSVKKYIPPNITPEDYGYNITYDPQRQLISLDLQENTLSEVFRTIMDRSGKNLFYTSGLDNNKLTAYIKDLPFQKAMEQLAYTNGLYVELNKDGYYNFENDAQPIANGNGNPNQSPQRPKRRVSTNFNYKIHNIETKELEIDMINTPIVDIINTIGEELNINIFTATPLDNAGTATFKTKSITFDDLLIKLFEAQQTAANVPNEGNNQNPNNGQRPQGQNGSIQVNSGIFTFKKEGNTYFFGTEQQLSVRKVEIIPLQYRSVELLPDPTPMNSNTNNVGVTGNFNNYSLGRFGGNGNFNNNNTNGGFNNQNNNRLNTQNQRQQGQVQQSQNGQSQSLLDIVPEEIKADLEFQTDFELNRFYVTGTSTKIERFKAFVKDIDKPVPVVLIEVMIVEVSRNNTVETGVEWGIGSEPTTTQGNIFPNADITLGANTVNRIIGSFDDFGGFNLGKVVPNFFARIKAMESNGNFKILSTPKLATLNGHRASFSNGQTTYYGVTQRDIFGADNPQTSEITNFFPIQAELGLSIKPSVSNDGQVLLDINVIQSSFGGRVAEDAPPDINSRTFTSIIRMQDQDIAILGGLEETSKVNSGSGVPFLARIPIIKYLFSKRVREARKSKLSVLIKPTVIY